MAGCMRKPFNFLVVMYPRVAQTPLPGLILEGDWARHEQKASWINVSRHPTSMDDPNSTPMLRPDGTLTVSSLPGMDGPEFYFLRDCSTQSGIAEIAARKSESKQRNLPLIRESEDRIAPGELSSCSNNLRIGALGSEP